MGYENGIEKGSSSKIGNSGMITLQKAVELGEYEPSVLVHFPEWQLLSSHARFQLVRQGLDNHERQLQLAWAEMNNVLDFSKKPELKETLKTFQEKIHKVWKDRERLYSEFSKML